MIPFIYSTLLLPLSLAQLHAVIQEDAHLSGAGVRTVLSKPSLLHLSSDVISSLFQEAVSSSFLSPSSSSLSKSLNVSNTRLLAISSQFPLSLFNKPTSSLLFHLQQIEASLFGQVDGFVDGRTVHSPLVLNGSSVQLDLDVQLLKDDKNLPFIKLSRCDIPHGFPLSVSYTKTLDKEVTKSLVSLSSHHAVSLIRSLICSRLYSLIEDRINYRLRLLPPRISLAEVTEVDLVKKLNEAEIVKRRSTSIRRSQTRMTRQSTRTKMAALLNHFDFSRAHNLFLDYSLALPPTVTDDTLIIHSSGEVSTLSSHTPFGPQPLPVLPFNNSYMIQLTVSDFVPNSLLYHGHKTGLFNTRVDPSTPHVGSMMRSSCDISSLTLFCVGDIFPTLRSLLPNRGLIFLFSTAAPPILIVRPISKGGILFQLSGIIEIRTVEGNREERAAGKITVDISGAMRMKMSATFVRGKVQLDAIVMKTLSPTVFPQVELEDASFFSHEIVQRMVNDLLKEGIPIPVHPLFKLRTPRLSLHNRAIVVDANFTLNSILMRQLVAAQLLG